MSSSPTMQLPRSGPSWLTLPLFIIGVMIVGASGAVFTPGGPNDWYAQLQRPPLAPPSWIFAPVWTTLYVMMATSAWLIWEARREQAVRWPLTLFAMQLLCNAAWSPLFFGAQQPLLALIDLVAMWALIVATIVSFARISRWAALLLVPYLAWVSFAGYLNAGFWWLNR
ncbi:MAG TPA: TspO/MBR family protein [Pirellulaceae bacterium]|nr:TspO/MBR family protein [Pirellulaceae bacterium]